MDSLPPGIEPLVMGGATVEAEPGLVRLSLPAGARAYTDAQLDDTAGLARARFRHSPPIRLSVRARASHADPPGTLGFGMWNDPFGFTLSLGGAGRRLPAAPQALWFFYGSAPNDMAFARPGVAHGWKAASLRSPAVPELLVAAGGGLAMALGLLRRFQAAAVGAALKRVRAAEARLTCRLDEWHDYSLEWTATGATFQVDSRTVLETPVTPRPPLGFVAWIDNQFAVVSPAAGLRFGILPVPHRQYLELKDLRLDRDSPTSVKS